MSSLVFLSGDFSSGSTLLFTLFRKTGEYHCLYEPLHERLLEYLVHPLRVYEHHYFVEDYFTEYQGFRELPELFDPRWGSSGLVLPSDAEAESLYRYLTYLIGRAYGRAPKVLLKFNRATFRLGWLRAKFPHARLVHIHRGREAQWRSIVARVRAHLGRDDVGEAAVDWNGMSLATWCEDLKGAFPELAAENFESGYARFARLWELSLAEHRRHADLSVAYEDLIGDFRAVCGRIRECVGCEADLAALERYVVAPEDQAPLAAGTGGWRHGLGRAWERVGMRTARLRLKLRGLLP